MTNYKLLEQFRSFYARNYPDDMEIQIEYFSIFGGLGVDVDTQKSIPDLLHGLIFDNFENISKNIRQLTLDDKNNKRLLRALAIGDRRIFSAFNRAGLNNSNGGRCLNYLQEKGLIQIEYSREEPARSLNNYSKLKREVARHRISHKVLFTYPFIRFWFYFIAPHYHEIANKDYESFFKNLQEKQNSYTSLVFEELSEILLNYNLRDAEILSSGSYWDANIEIDILTITKDEKTYVGECKWTNHKVNKSEWSKILEKCERLEIKPTQIILFSKRGFSKELKLNQGKDLALYTSSDFEALVKNAKSQKLIKSLFN
ncbi:MAG: ATPase [Sulfurimonas sp.]|nr:MAG: ATPase [Sulfurimonas sp.]